MRLFIEFIGGSWDGELFDLDDEFPMPAQDLTRLFNHGTLFIMPTRASAVRMQSGDTNKVICEQWRLTNRQQGVKWDIVAMRLSGHTAHRDALIIDAYAPYRVQRR